MLSYILRRLLLMIPTLFGIMLVNFIVIQAAPGGPVEQAIAELRGDAVSATARISSGTAGEVSSGSRASRGIDPELIEELKKQYGFDKPPAERFWQMIKDYLRFDFGESFFRDRSVISLIGDTLPVSISLGLWTTLLIYLISIPLGIRKAIKDGSNFDITTSMIIVIGNAIPSFLFAILLIILFAGGQYFDWFPLRGLTSDGFDEMGVFAKIKDYFWHVTLPIIAMVISGFAGLTLLTKNSFLDEIGKQYVLTARAKGLSENAVLYKHVFRNAMLIVIAGFPRALMGILFTGALLIETIFSLNGLGLLGFEAAIGRDYPVMFGTLYIFTLMGMVLTLIGDLVYIWVDPRIDFERRG